MIVAKRVRAIVCAISVIGLSLALFVAAQVSPVPSSYAAAGSAGQAAPDGAVRAPDIAGNPASMTPASAALPDPATGYHRMKPTLGIGMPTPGSVSLQKQFSPLGEYASWIHDAVLMPIITVITLFVLGLLIWVVGRYNVRSNPIASRTSHNTLIEVVWTLLPVLILVGIAIPSIDLLAKQYKPAPAKALTIKATGNQWFWTYTYPDNGGFEVTSYMLNLPSAPTVNGGVRVVGSDPSDGPAHLEVDNRMVVPAGEPIRMQITGADVIHSFAVPSLWFKLDAVPGRINEKVLFIEKPGVYYGQCSELCGAKHAYMPIAVEALPRKQFNAWVLAQSGGVIDHQPGAAAPASAADAVPAAATPSGAPAVPAPAASTPAASPPAASTAAVAPGA